MFAEYIYTFQTLIVIVLSFLYNYSRDNVISSNYKGDIIAYHQESVPECALISTVARVRATLAQR